MLKACCPLFDWGMEGKIMSLELGRIPIEEIELGQRTFIDGKALHIDQEEFIRMTWGGDSRITSIEVRIARPGESIRIIPI